MPFSGGMELITIILFLLKEVPYTHTHRGTGVYGTCVCDVMVIRDVMAVQYRQRTGTVGYAGDAHVVSAHDTSGIVIATRYRDVTRVS